MRGSPPPPVPASLIHPSPSAISIKTSSPSSYFISQINLQNSTEILCVLIAPVKTSETLPSAGGGRGMAGSRSLGTGNPPGRLAVPSRAVGGWGEELGRSRPQPQCQPSPRGAACGRPSDLRPAEYPPHQGATQVPFSCNLWLPSVPGRHRPQVSRRCCGQAQDPSPPPRPWLLTGCGVFLE